MPLDLPDGLDRTCIEKVIADALEEDLGAGDITCQAVIPETTYFAGAMVARQDIVLAGLPIAAEVFRRLSSQVAAQLLAADGDAVSPGTRLMTLAGPARQLLMGERTALNILQQLSGIATLTRAYVERIAGTGAILLDTRKTIPGLRRLSKYATRMGGAQNHRMGLYDGILIKDNHLAVCGGVRAAVNKSKAVSGATVEVECDTLDQVREAAEAGADFVLLDNMPPDTLREAIAIVAGRCKTEASGGITLETIRAVAETGVDYISCGALTQSAPAVDIGLDWTPGGDAP